MSTSAVATAGAAFGARVRSVLWHHPEWWAGAIAVAAWGVVHSGPDAATTVYGDASHHGGYTGAPWTHVSHASLMIVAMMAPLTLPTLCHLSLSSLWSRRYRAQVMFLIGYLGTWVLVLVALDLAVSTIHAGFGRPVAIVLFFGGATAWQFAPAKRRALNRCARTVPIAPRGLRADCDCIRFGAGAGRACLVTCAPLMAALVASGHSFVAMLVLFVVQLYERVARSAAPEVGAAATTVLGLILIAATI